MEIRVQDVRSPKPEIESQIKGKYGKYSYVRDISENNGIYDISIGFRIPRSFNDKRLGKMFYKHLEMDNLAVATGYYDVENSKELRIELPNQEEVSERIEEYIQSIRRNIEVKLVSELGEKLVDLPGVKNEFSKVRKILTVLRVKNQTDFSQLMEDEGDLTDYLQILVSLGYLKEIGDQYEERDQLKQKYEDFGNEAYKHVIRDIIVEKIEHLREMGLTNVLPYIRILETYYFVAMNTRGEEFEITIPQLRRQYHIQHNEDIPETELMDKLACLVEEGILERENEFFKGKRTVSQRILQGSQVTS